MDANDLLDAQIYVGTYKKYNEGSIFGKWMKLSDYSDKEEFYEACAKLHSDEEDAEFMFQDWENIPKGMISESWISESIFELISQVDDIKEFDAFMEFLDFTGYSLDKQDLGYLLSKFNDCYAGKYDSEVAFAEQYVDDCYSLSDFVQTYFDYDKFAHDLFVGDYYYSHEVGAVFNRSY